MNELNRLVLAVNELATRTGADWSKVRRLCTSVTLGGGVPALSDTLAWAVAFELLSRTQHGRVKLTSLGRRFVTLNPEGTYELTVRQRQLLASHCVAARGVQGCRELLAKCVPCYERGRFELPKAAIRPGDLQRLSVLVALRVCAHDDFGTYVADEYSREVRGQHSRKKLSALEMKFRLRDQDKVGADAEMFVLRLEQERLRAAGLPLEASLVRRISHLDVAAGYDIDSFDSKWGGDYDRRVEVKATVGDRIRFYWTRNEMSVALREGKRYWLYLVTAWDRRRHSGVVHRLRDPAAFFAVRRGLCSVESVVSEVTLSSPDRLGWDSETGVWA